MSKQQEPDLRFASETDVMSGLDRPDNSILICIANYPSDEFREKTDVYERDVAPPNNIWDEFLQSRTSGDQGRGHHRFKAKYIEWLSDDALAYKRCQEIKAYSLVRPIYIAHHGKSEMYSPATILIQFIKGYVELPAERDDSMDISNWG
jgi:hypothetical protein